VISTPVNMGEVKLAKFHSFLYDIINKDLPNRLYNKCHHGAVTVQKLWLLKSKSMKNVKICLKNCSGVIYCSDSTSSKNKLLR